jgi:hypothetical protein
MEPFDRVVHASTFGEIIAECRGEIDILAACRLSTGFSLHPRV